MDASIARVHDGECYFYSLSIRREKLQQQLLNRVFYLASIKSRVQLVLMHYVTLYSGVGDYYEL